jgi:hypothetical protein
MMTRRRMALGVVAAVIVVAIPLLASSCASAREVADAASLEFRMRISRSAYDEIVRSAAPEFQAATTASDFAKTMESLKERLGAWQSSEEPAWKVLAGISAQTVTLVYNSHFERGTATEEFVWRVRQGRSALAGYHVKSSAQIAQ